MKKTLLALFILISAALIGYTARGQAAPLPQTTPPPDDSDCTIPGMTEESPIYSHQIYLTYTQDGKTFPTPAESQLILDHASVADLVIGPDDALWAYFVNGETGKHGIFAARQTEDGFWETLGCVKLDGEFNGNAVDPNVTRLPDGRYRLVYFVGNFVSQTLQPGEENPIYSAISEDGLHFTVEGQIFAYPGATDPSLVQLPDGSWLLAVTAGGQTVIARSEDGTAFSQIGQPVQEIGIPELFVFPDGSVGLYLSRLFLSNDGGQTWEAVDDVQIPGNGADPSLVALPEGGYAFSFKQISGGGEMGAPGEQGSPGGMLGEQGTPGGMPGGGAGPGGMPGGAPPFNPFENLTAEQETCLKEAWGEEAFNEITSFQRPPDPSESESLEPCGLEPPPGAPQGNMPPGGAMGGAPEGGAPGGMNAAQGNPQDVTLNLQITAPYLMAFHVCDTATEEGCDFPTHHQVYLAQSEDGENWQVVPGWQPFQGSVPGVVRRGETIYIFTPGAVTRYHMDTGVLEATQPVMIDGLPDGFVDPAPILDEEGRLVLFFVPGVIGGDPGGCNDEPQCERVVRSAVEVTGSDGTRFQPAEGNRVSITVGESQTFRSLSDPAVFADDQGMILLTSHGLSVQAWTSPELHGEYAPLGLLTYGGGGVPGGYFDPQSGQYWIYVHYSPNPQTPTDIRMARVTDLSRQLDKSAFHTVLTAESIGLGATYLVASPSVILYQQP